MDDCSTWLPNFRRTALRSVFHFGGHDCIYSIWTSLDIRTIPTPNFSSSPASAFSSDKRIEVPLFLDSKASRLIQMADIVAYWTFRYFQSSDHRGFSLIRPFCADRGDANDGLITDLSTETTAKLANAA